MADYVPPRPCAPGIWQVTLPLGPGVVPSVNAYLIEGSEGITLVDCGLGTDQTWELLTRSFDDLHVRISDVDRILLTHAHPDHSGLVERLAAASSATIWAHQYDLDYFQRRFVDPSGFRAQMREWLQDQGTPIDEAGPLAGMTDVPHPRTSELVDSAQTYSDGDVIDIGPYHLTVTWTPGHTPGHVCFVDESYATVLCGDHILPSVSPNVGFHSDTPSNPLPAYLKSLETFGESMFSVTLPGHGEALFDIQSRARDLWRRQMERRERILEFISEDALTPYELAGRVWADARPAAWPEFRGHIRRNAIATLVAHLELLRDEGGVGRSDEAPYRYWRLHASRG